MSAAWAWRGPALAACGIVATISAAAAQDWKPSLGAFARFGLISEACRSDGHTSICLALACRSGGLELVSAAGGGGPMEGVTTIRFGSRSAVAKFVWDRRAVDLLGIAASRAEVAADLVSEMAAADRIALRAQDANDGVIHDFSTSGFKRELQRATVACARRKARRA